MDWDAVKFVLSFVLILVVLIGGLILLNNMWESHTCYAKTINMGFAHHWDFFGGCRIEVKPGQWIPLESYYFKQQ